MTPSTFHLESLAHFISAVTPREVVLGSNVERHQRLPPVLRWAVSIERSWYDRVCGSAGQRRKRSVTYYCACSELSMVLCGVHAEASTVQVESDDNLLVS